MQKLALTVTDIDVSGGELIPVTTLVQADFKFIKASDNVTEVDFTGFTNNGNGNYLFWGFDVPVYSVDLGTTGSPRGEQVRLKINDVFQDGYGTFNVYHDDDESPSFSFTYNRVDRDGDTVFYWITYVPDALHSPPFDPYDPSTAAFPDDVLVCNKYIVDNFGGLDSPNVWTGAANTNYVTPTMADDSPEYLAGAPDFPSSLVWKSWIEDNFGSASAGWSIEGNALLVDKNLVSNVVGKKYNNLNTAIAYAQSQSPGILNRWKIYIMPYMIGNTQSYTDNLTVYPYIDLIGIGQVKLSCSITQSGSWSGVPKSFWKNIDFERVNTNQTLQSISFDNCNLYIWNVSSTHTLTITTSQLKNTGLYVIEETGTGIIASGTGNRVINCYGNYDISWDASTDKIYSYAHVDDVTEIYFNGTSY